MVEQHVNDLREPCRHSCGMAKRSQTNPYGQTHVYAGRQPGRPHYVKQLMERRGFKTYAEFAKQIGADKSMVTRWLDEDHPTTPGKVWARRLGVFFGSKDEPVDIFSDPNVERLRQFLHGLEPHQIQKILDLVASITELRRK